MNNKSVLKIIPQKLSLQSYLFILFQLVFLSNTVSLAQWVQTNGPFGGDVREMVINGNNYFACVDGDVYISSNNGNNWKATSLVNNGVNDLVSINGLILAGSGGGGIFLSSDDGNNWAPANNGLPAGNVDYMTAIGELLFVDISNNIVGQPGYGIFRSTDSGTNWVSANNGLTGP
jgi:photosystem II stability/assembly factor-like uncharacterized protein